VQVPFCKQRLWLHGSCLQLFHTGSRRTARVQEEARRTTMGWWSDACSVGMHEASRRTTMG
jgi:hypothetical protein